MTGAQLVIMAKEPLPGRVKTRLEPAYGMVGAAALATAALLDTLDAANGSRALQVLLALDGEVGAWLPDGVTVLRQRSGSFGDRLAGAVADAYALKPLPVLVIGMDTPQATPDLLDEAMAGLDDSEAVLGPADDGGFWCLGLRLPDARVFAGVPMSRSDTGRRQLAQLVRLGLRTRLVEALSDVDTPEDVARVAALAPGSRFAAVALELNRGAA